MITTLAVITARGGSKGIVRKNIKKLAGKPLIAYTIAAAKAAQKLNRCIVSTDDNEIAAVARQCGADVPFMRPAELAQDDSTSLEVVQHVLQTLRAQGETYDYLMILQPTSPLRTVADIDACIAIAADTGADSVMSMYELEDFSLKKLKCIDEQGKILPYFEDEGASSARRQSIGAVYKRNCAIYLTKTALIERGDLFGIDSRAYVMPFERSVDINSLVDFELAEFFMHKSS